MDIGRPVCQVPFLQWQKILGSVRDASDMRLQTLVKKEEHIVSCFAAFRGNNNI